MSGTLSEHLHGSVTLNRIGGLVLREKQPLNADYPFFLQIQAFARRNNDFYVGSRAQNVADQGSSVEQMLKIVEEQQHAFFTQVIDDLYAGFFEAVQREFERAGDS